MDTVVKPRYDTNPRQ
ncbi:MAG TPA: hypothetical protein LFW20_05810 [Rickettsia endosymbiont of Omalisus fontisbellaquei]|nr:hypothetical protein [Rickettsia endosymbiont of Omalisus fontisbellaquei]